MSNKLKKAYKSSISIYDDILTQQSFWGKMYMKVFWSGTDDTKLAYKILDYIPDDFSGKLLDVPTGTAVFTHKKWTSLSNAQIVCLDYSQDMLDRASEKFEGCNHITCVRGDVGNIELPNDDCDIVISMNGFHAFPDTASAYKEIHRVLKDGGSFIACFYVKGEGKTTDWLVKNILAKKGWFTPPFQSKSDVTETLNKLFKQVDINIDGSMIYFKCVK